MDTLALVEEFSEIDTSDFPDFYNYKRPLEMGLWILWVTKEKLQKKQLTAEQIASIIRDGKEISIDAKSLNNAFARAKEKVHIYHKNGQVHFEIMKPGKDALLSLAKDDSMQVFYFEPGKKYSSKKILAKKVLEELKGKLRIVDPYCGERTLDVLKDISDRTVMFLTRLKNLHERKRNRFLRELQDFKSDYSNFEFRNYPFTDIHDRYIISGDSLVVLGCSLKDLGNKESFAMVLERKTNKNITEALIENFDRRWKAAEKL